MTMKRATCLTLIAALLALVVTGCDKGPAQDEAKQAGKTVADFPEAAEDYFHDMDGGVSMTDKEIKGRNTWLVWTGGNEAFWDYLANHSYGTFDLLKMLSSYPCSAEQQTYVQQTATKAYGSDATPYYSYYNRDKRFSYLGAMNEPGFRKATKPDQYGLCLDERVAAPEPFNEKVYGRASGVLGLRIYPNPNFDKKAAEHWNANQFYTNPTYYSDRKLVRPYRVGMSCAFCHVSHHPLFPPQNPEQPEFRNLSGTIGAQYFWFGRIFGPNLSPDNFVWHLLDSQQPGAVDTSFLPTDYITNPRAMNAVFNLPARLEIAKRFHQETSAGGALNLPQVKKEGPTSGAPMVLWDGADSVGIDAALTRVYINIGEYHQEWLRHIDPLVGLKLQTPIEVAVAQTHSVYWNATQERSANLASYLIKAGSPMPLAQAPGGQRYLQGDREAESYTAQLTRGKVVFAENCARCHSSKIPKPAPGFDEGVACGGAAYKQCWERYWNWTQTDEFKGKMRDIVLADDFLTDNYLSTDARIPVTLLETEICSSMASNAIAGHVWDNFSSATYKSLPSVGAVQLEDPVQGKTFTWNTPGGGRGYQRVPSLIAIWSTAPFLHNNEVGTFTGNPSTEGRMQAFDDAIHKLLWPERRPRTVRIVRSQDDYGRAIGPVAIKVYTTALPSPLDALLAEGWLTSLLRKLGFGDLVGEGVVEIGPIPKGTPVGLLANLNLDLREPQMQLKDLTVLLLKAKNRLKQIELQKLSEAQATDVLKELEPDLLKASACPDFIVDRGHYFGKDLPDADKEALIEFIKTF